VEAVLAVAYCKFLQKDRPDTDAWMVMGTAARLALRMGYHRDPSQFPNLSPFEGEMRRRVFFLVEAFDLLLSFQAGLPPIISEGECDTEAPRNLLDEDFDEDCTELPPSRPPIEATSMLYFRYKSLFAKYFRRVIRHALSLKNPLYEDTMQLDKELLQIRFEMPSCLEMRRLSSFVDEKASMVFDLLNIDLMYLKCVCVLHRKYITQERSNEKYEYSRRVCNDAALKILAHQKDLHAVCQPGGKFFEDKWMVSTLILYDFILAAMVVCLDLYESRNASSRATPEELQVRAQRYELLAHTLDIWNERRDSSQEARRASNVLSAMLSKIPRPAASYLMMDLPLGNSQQQLENRTDLVATPSAFRRAPVLENSEILLSDRDFGAENNAVFDFSSALFTEADQIDWVWLLTAILVLC
jgi:Fungal specific transcription factor domain